MGVGAALLIGGAVAGGAAAYMAGQGGGAAPSRSPGSEVGAMPTGQYVDQLEKVSESQLKYNQLYAQQVLANLPAMGTAGRRQRNLEDERVRKQFPLYTALERQETSKQRSADFGDVQQYGGLYAKLFGELAPGYAQLEAEIDKPRNTDILDKLRQQALYELDLGGSLGADEQRTIEQATRGAYAARGLEYSNPALASEVLARSGAERMRLGERRNFAGAVQGLEQSAQGTRISQLIAATQARLNPILGAIGTRTGVNPGISTAASAPAMTPMSVASTLSGAPQASASASALSPLYGYMGSAYGGNQQAAMQAQQMDFQAQQAQAQAVGSLAGGAMSYGGSLYKPSAGGTNAMGEAQYLTGTVPRAGRV